MGDDVTLFSVAETIEMVVPPGEPRRIVATQPSVRARDPETSREASALAALGASALRKRCLAALRERPMTDFELAEAVSSQQTSAGKRRLELERAGLVEWAGTWRPSPSGARARVWRVVEP